MGVFTLHPSNTIGFAFELVRVSLVWMRLSVRCFKNHQGVGYEPFLLNSICVLLSEILDLYLSEITPTF